MIVFLNVGEKYHDYGEVWKRFDVYYDLDHDRAEEVDWLEENSVCCVIRYVDNEQKQGDVVLAFWRHRDIQALNHDEWGKTLVFRGEKIGEFQLAKDELSSHPQFDGVLNRDGNFNRFSVMRCPFPSEPDNTV